MIIDGGEYVVKPMRYHCRLNGKPNNYDTRHPGLYNARRDNLERYWKDVFTRQHGIIMVTRFFENVALHDYEKRLLRKDENASNLVLQFKTSPPSTMLFACLWDRWQSEGQEDLYSFAIITDDPPAEVAATGHDRCPISLKPENIEPWLECTGDSAAHFRLFDDRVPVYYEHKAAARTKCVVGGVSRGW